MWEITKDSASGDTRLMSTTYGIFAGQLRKASTLRIAFFAVGRGGLTVSSTPCFFMLSTVFSRKLSRSLSIREISSFTPGMRRDCTFQLSGRSTPHALTKRESGWSTCPPNY